MTETPDEESAPDERGSAGDATADDAEPTSTVDERPEVGGTSDDGSAGRSGDLSTGPGPDDAAETDAGDEAGGDEAGGDEAGADATGANEANDASATGDRDLVARVREHDEDLAEELVDVHEDLETYESEVADLREQLAAREEEVEDLTARLKRKQADFQNYKKRQEERRAELRERATEDLVRRLVPVRDNLRRALEQEEGTDIREGVERTLERFDEVLDEENVEPIEPEPGDEVDPQRHEVMMRAESAVPEGDIAQVFKPGYEMGDRVVQEAQVAVSKGGGAAKAEADEGVADDTVDDTADDTPGSSDAGDGDRARGGDDAGGASDEEGGDGDDAGAGDDTGGAPKDDGGTADAGSAPRDEGPDDRPGV